MFPQIGFYDITYSGLGHTIFLAIQWMHNTPWSATHLTKHNGEVIFMNELQNFISMISLIKYQRHFLLWEKAKTLPYLDPRRLCEHARYKIQWDLIIRFVFRLDFSCWRDKSNLGHSTQYVEYQKTDWIWIYTFHPLYVVFASKPVVWLHWNERTHHFDCLASQNLGDHSN